MSKKKELNPADAHRRALKKKEKERNKQERQKSREFHALLNNREKLEEEIRKAEQLAEENKLDKSYRKRVQELKDMQKIALQKERQKQQTLERARALGFVEDDEQKQDTDARATSSSTAPVHPSPYALQQPHAYPPSPYGPPPGYPQNVAMPQYPPQHPQYPPHHPAAAPYAQHYPPQYPPPQYPPPPPPPRGVPVPMHAPPIGPPQPMAGPRGLPIGGMAGIPPPPPRPLPVGGQGGIPPPPPRGPPMHAPPQQHMPQAGMPGFHHQPPPQSHAGPPRPRRTGGGGRGGGAGGGAFDPLDPSSANYTERPHVSKERRKEEERKRQHDEEDQIQQRLAFLRQQQQLQQQQEGQGLQQQAAATTDAPLSGDVSSRAASTPALVPQAVVESASEGDSYDDREAPPVGSMAGPQLSYPHPMPAASTEQPTQGSVPYPPVQYPPAPPVGGTGAVPPPAPGGMNISDDMVQRLLARRHVVVDESTPAAPGPSAGAALPAQVAPAPKPAQAATSILPLAYGSDSDSDSDEEGQEENDQQQGPSMGPSIQRASSPDIGPALGPSRPPAEGVSYGSYPDPDDYEPAVGPAIPPPGYQYESYPEVAEVGPEMGVDVGPSRPPPGYTAMYPEAAEVDQQQEPSQPQSEEQVQPAKTKAAVSAELVGFVPTHLRVKRSLTQAKPQPAKVAKKSEEPTPKSESAPSSNDAPNEYEAFMKEIEALGASSS